MTLRATPTGSEAVRLVPVEASDAMMDRGVEAALRQMPDSDGNVGYVQLRAAWSAMLSAAPSVSAPGREAVARAVAVAIWGPDAASVYFDSHRADERYHRSLAAADAILALTGTGAGWQPIETAPRNEIVEVRAGRMTFEAILRPDASYTDENVPCDQWQAAREGEHPPCWSEGACWASNEDEVASLAPNAWRPTTNPRASTPADTGAGQGEGAGV